MVTATTGQMSIVSVKGKRFGASLYISDVVAAPVTFSMSGIAVVGSANYFVMPERGIITDLALVTGPTVIFAYEIFVNSIPIGIIANNAVHVSTSPNRPPLNIKVEKGSIVIP